jgi:glycerol uptake facilitator protein
LHDVKLSTAERIALTRLVRKSFVIRQAGCLVWAIGLSLGGTTGYAINPARDLGPRIAHAVLPIAGKGNSDWSYAPIPIVGPLIGASLAGLLVHALHF